MLSQNRIIEKIVTQIRNLNILSTTYLKLNVTSQHETLKISFSLRNWSRLIRKKKGNWLFHSQHKGGN